METLYGRNPVLEALRSGKRRFEVVTRVQGIKPDSKLKEILRLARSRRMRMEELPREKISRLAGTPKHQGIIARVSPLPLLTFDEILERGIAGGEKGLLLFLDGVEDPRNLGALLRSAESLGVDGLFLSPNRSAGLNPTVAKASAGALEHLNIGIIKNLATSLEIIKSSGFWCIGLDSAGEEVCGKFDFQRPTFLVVGGEGSGIRRMVKDRCDTLLRINLPGQTSSLNVSCAAAIAIYEIQRSRITASS